MQNLENRIAALESQSRIADENLKVVLVSADTGETQAEAMARADYMPDDPCVMCVLLVARLEQPNDCPA